MEINGDGLLEELVSVGRETWEGNPGEGEGEGENEMNGFFSTNGSWGFDGNSAVAPPLLLPILPNSYDLDCSFFNLVAMEDYSELQGACKSPLPLPLPAAGGLCWEKKNNLKKPSKNLMAERRRRKRLNDRLSMLRSVVPKISKMDRTSILGDTIDYMKELLQRINNLQEEINANSSQVHQMTIFKDPRQNDNTLMRNSPKFDVERRDNHTRVEISCSGKQGLLLSTVTTLEALGLQIQQCVISCFNDFSLHAACSEDMEEQTTLVSSQDIKQALFRNAGYGGRCF